MSDTFTYRNKVTGKSEQRPTEPNFFQKAYENAAYPEDLDRQRDSYKRAQNELGNSDKAENYSGSGE